MRSDRLPAGEPRDRPARGAPHLILVRHGATALNSRGRYQGRVDPPLSVAGLLQARALAGPIGDAANGAVVRSSDRRRALETAHLVLPGSDPEPDPRLRELDFGLFDGRSYMENRERHGPAFDAWVRDPASVAPPGGETLPELRRRVLGCLRDAPAGGMVAFTHAGPIRIAMADALGTRFDDTWRWRIEPGDAVRITCGEHGASVERMRGRAAGRCGPVIWTLLGRGPE